MEIQYNNGMKVFVFIATATLAVLSVASPYGRVERESVVPLSRAVSATAQNAAPQVALVRSSADLVELTVAVPAIRCAQLATRHGAFTEVSLEGCGPSDTVGLPSLPMVRRLLVAPLGATITVDLHATPAIQSANALALAAPVMPRQNLLPKLRGAADSAPFAQDTAAYATDAWFPRDQVRVTEAGVFAGHRLVLVEYAPVRYNPSRHEYSVADTATITVRFIGGTLPTQPLSPREDRQLASLAINHTATTGVKSGGRLLMIAYDPFVSQLAPYVAHKAVMGWSVVLTNAIAAGSSATNIRAFIHTMYTNAATRPDMVLLVGDVEQVPCFTGVGADSPDTDLYYGCMDGDADWEPEFPVGRISASTAGQLDAIVAKTTAYETGGHGDWCARACFMASEDNFAVSEGTHNWVIDTYMTPLGYSSDKLYCHTYSATRDQVTNAFNAGRALGIYSGHGSQTSWADGPAFGEADVRGLMNTANYPFVCSFACLTGAMSLDECFAETWLRTPAAAAVNIWASSVTSYWDQDDVLERRLFSALYDHNAFAFGAATMLAKQFYLAYYGATDPTTRRYFEQYNLFGDPTVTLAQPRLTIITGAPLPAAFTGEQYRCVFDAAGGTAPYTNWSVASGSLPDGLALVPTNGVLEGVPLTPTTSVFSVRLADASGSACTSSFSLAVLTRLSLKPGLAWPSPTNVPDAIVDTPYNLPLEALGGTPPYTWSLLPQQEWYSELVATIRMKAKCAAQHWNADDQSWPLALPHPFPFYGHSHTSLWVSSNGFIDFGSASPDPHNSATSLAAHVRIAPLWLDLTTERGDIYFYSHPTSTFTLVRWKAHVYTTGKSVAASVYLYTNGVIRFAYDAKLTVPSPTIGVSKGDMLHYTLSGLDGTSPIPRGTASTLAYNTANTCELALTNGNVLAGTPTHPGSSLLGVVVNDSGTQQQSITNELVFSVVPEPTAVVCAVILLLARRSKVATGILWRVHTAMPCRGEIDGTAVATCHGTAVATSRRHA